MPTVAPDSSRRQAYPDPIPGILPFGTVSIFSAASGAGKTTMLAEWCARWQDERTIFGHPTNPPTALCYIAADRSWDTDHALWFQTTGCTRIRVYSLADDENLPPASLRAEGADALLSHCLNQLAPPPGALIFIDPLTPLFIGGNPNDQRPVALALLRMGRACRRRQITILATAYFGKQKGDAKDRYIRPVDRIAGSGVFAGYSHTQMYLVESEDLIEQPYHTFGWKPRHAPEEEFQIVRDGTTGLFVPYLGLKDESPILEQDRPSQLLLLIPDDGISVTDLLALAVEQLLVSRATIFRDLQVLQSRGSVRRDRHGWISRRLAS